MAKKNTSNIPADRSAEKSGIEGKRRSDIRFWFRFLSLGVVVPVYVALIVCMAVLPRSTVSEIEKRNLAEFPEFSWSDYWSGRYTADVANYYDDTVPFRDTLKQAASRLLGFLGVKYNDVQVSGSMSVVNNNNDTADKSKPNTTDEKNTQSAVSSKTDTKKDTDSEDKGNTKDFGQEIAEGVYTNGQIVVYQDGHYRALSMYGGGTGETFAASVNNVAADLSGVKVYTMVIPTPGEFYTPSNFSDYNASQEDSINSIASALDSGVQSINICPTMRKHLQEPIYSRTDHHWMALGAYYAAQQFAKTAGVQFADISEYNKKTIDGYVGTMYAFTDNNASLLNDPEDFVYYEPKSSITTDYYSQSFQFEYTSDLLVEISLKSELYSTYMGGDGHIVHIKTPVSNGRKLAVVKDSYGNAEIPFYTGSFEDIYVLDMRYIEVNLVDFVRDRGVTDLLFSMCSFSAVGTNADNLETLRTQHKGFAYDEVSSKDDEGIADEQSQPEDIQGSGGDDEPTGNDDGTGYGDGTVNDDGTFFGDGTGNDGGTGYDDGTGYSDDGDYNEY